MESESKASREFYELCYDQYKLEIEEAEKLYQKVAILLIIIPILVGATIQVGRVDLFPQLFTRVDFFLYYLSCFISWITIGVSAAYAIICIYPRQYKRIENMEGWQDWRQRYKKYIEETNNNETVDDAMIRDISPRLADAQTCNAPINEKRRKCFQKSLFFASIGFCFISVQAIFYLILILEGFKHVR